MGVGFFLKVHHKGRMVCGRNNRNQGFTSQWDGVYPSCPIFVRKLDWDGVGTLKPIHVEREEKKRKEI